MDEQQIPQELTIAIKAGDITLASIATNTVQFVRLVKKHRLNVDEEGNLRPVTLSDIVQYIGRSTYLTGENYKEQVKDHDAQLLTACLGRTNNNVDEAVALYKTVIASLDDPNNYKTEAELLESES